MTPEQRAGLVAYYFERAHESYEELLRNFKMNRNGYEN